MFDRDSKSLEGEIVRVGRYCARLALSKDDLLAAQELRYRCFKLSNDKCLDVDCSVSYTHLTLPTTLVV